MFQKTYQYLINSKLKYLVFWILIFIFSTAHSSSFYASTTELFTVYSIRVSIQIIIAYLIIEYLIPTFLNKGRKTSFGVGFFSVLLIAYIVCTAISKYYLEVIFPDTFTNYLKRFSSLDWLGRMTNGREIISKSLNFLYPTFLILVFKLYSEKQRLLKLNEQKKSAELTALKNQLNPHFLFNTLNNLYALALKKSDDTTLVIQKLSNILDYILYKCDEEFVLLENEITLIKNYLSLEKIRYGDRVNISFQKDITGKEKIAPLLFLTFIENAFKHGVKEEINQAKIEIEIAKKDEQLMFSVKNTKPKGVEIMGEKKSIGLQNIKKQLDLLYPKAYNLMIQNKPNSFSANLKLNII